LADARRFMVEAVAIDAAFHGDATGRDELSSRVLAALGSVPRHAFVPAEHAAGAYENRPVPLSGGRTLPRPYLSAVMADLLELGPGSRVLEVGTGSGYQAAILSLLAGRVVSVEPVAELAAGAIHRLARLGYAGVEVHHADGLAGWPEAAPYDAILVTLAVGETPPALFDQLRPGGKLLLPLGQGASTVLTLVSKNDKGKLKPKPRGLLEVDFEPLPPFRAED
jgi:protein-L-isoaspartate(D-aspartate) O-methyltransferase